MKGKRRAINKIMADFAFWKVKDVMVASNITWTKDDEEYIPTEDELRLKAEEMLKDCSNSPHSYCKIVGNGFVCRKSATSLELSYIIDHKWG